MRTSFVSLPHACDASFSSQSDIFCLSVSKLCKECREKCLSRARDIIEIKIYKMLWLYRLRDLNLRKVWKVWLPEMFPAESLFFHSKHNLILNLVIEISKVEAKAEGNHCQTQD